jgi:tetratricopeptide (TPR) repeat protein
VAFTRAVEEDEIMKDALAGNVLFYIKNPDTTGYVEQNRVYLYPTFLVLDSDGEALYTWIGWDGSGKWVEYLDSAIGEPLTVDERRARFEADPAFNDAYMLGITDYARRDARQAHDYFRRTMELDEVAARGADVPIFLFRTAYRGIGVGDFTMEECGAVAEEVLCDKQVKTEYALEIGTRLVRVANDVGEDVIIPYLRMAYPTVEKESSEELRLRCLRFLGDYALIVEKDPEKAVDYNREAMPEGWRDDPAQLNRFAWWCFEHKANLTEAEELSRRSVELAEDNRVKANCLDTLAEIVNLSGDTAGALDLIEQGLEIDPDNDYLKKQRTRFEEALAGAG